jgi:hypothetical protein
MVGEMNPSRAVASSPRSQTIEWDEFSRLLVSRRKLTWFEMPGSATPSLFDPEANTYYVVASQTSKVVGVSRR